MEMLSYAVNIHKNTVQCMQILLDAQQSLQISIEDPEAQVLRYIYPSLCGPLHASLHNNYIFSIYNLNILIWSIFLATSRERKVVCV